MVPSLFGKKQYSATCTMLVLVSLAVPSLTLACVRVCSCVGVNTSYVESLKFQEGGMVLQQYFHPRKCACSAVQ